MPRSPTIFATAVLMDQDVYALGTYGSGRFIALFIPLGLESLRESLNWGNIDFDCFPPPAG